MGYYIDPENEPKEEFLKREATRANAFDKYSEIPKSKALLCMVNNYSFKAVGICFSQRELDDWNSSRDTRPKEWFLIDREKVYAVSNITPERFEN